MSTQDLEAVPGPGELRALCGVEIHEDQDWSEAAVLPNTGCRETKMLSLCLYAQVCKGSECLPPHPASPQASIGLELISDLTAGLPG